MSAFDVIEHAGKAATAAASGRYLEAAREAIEVIVEVAALLEPEDRSKLLDEVAVRRANAIADLAEQAKFGALPALEDLGSHHLAESEPPPPDDEEDDP